MRLADDLQLRTAKQRKKHKKSELFTPKFLDSLRGALKAAPQKAPSRLTKKDIVMALKDEIFDLVERGYSYGNICDILGDKNFKISPIVTLP
ncbi:hypothetical protein [Fundidesulfovibrio putealis]|uniref:hypothetical protein n=1 Tax=Fundidesulfovibrio putealis TaxID=270496 RepID=UPI0012EB534C|nr:hypothetical protein [Fundidesulfovibrio putealis]